MNSIELKLDAQQRGAFVIQEGDERLAEMAIGIQPPNLIVYHTEVAQALQGQGIAAQLLEQMIAYARENKLQVVPLCPYVHAHFKRHPDQYADLWNKNWRQ